MAATHVVQVATFHLRTEVIATKECRHQKMGHNFDCASTLYRAERAKQQCKIAIRGWPCLDKPREPGTCAQLHSAFTKLAVALFRRFDSH